MSDESLGLTRREQLTLGELFAGYGGLGMAVEEVFDATTAWFSEFEEGPSKILARHWPDVPNHGDITKIDWSSVEPVDIMSGGSPCQDLSLAGRRKGMTEGTRSNLWETMREGIAIIRPKYVVWENVRGALSAGAISEMEHAEGRLGADGDPNLRAIGRVLGDLSDLGYDAEWRGLRAAEVGAPHGRFRVFLLAQDANLAVGDEWRLTAPGQAQGGRTRPNTGRRSGAPATNTSSSRRPEGQDGGAGGGDACSGVWGLEPQRSSGERVDTATNPRSLHSERWGIDGHMVGAAGAREAHGGEREWHGNATDYREPTNRASAINWGDYEPAIRRWERINGPAPRPTEPTGRDNAHRLSPAFVEWMMGLPAGWVTDVPGVNRNAQLKALGNGVAPQQAMAALRDMLAAFENERIAA